MLDIRWDWVKEHIADDPSKLRLKYAGKGYDNEILQVECRRKYAAKFADTLSRAPRFTFPDTLAAEQATSDLLAAFHAGLVLPDEALLDMTAGLGIDLWHCALRASSSTGCEMRPGAAEVLAGNMSELVGDKKLTVFQGNSLDYIGSTADVWGTVFVDPARRSATGRRTFALADCEPDITALIPTLRKRCRRLLVKMSPMLDVTHTATALGHECRRIMAIGTATECKELVAVLDFEPSDTQAATIEAVTLGQGGSIDVFSFTAAQEREAEVVYGTPKAGDWLYEFHPAVIKVGPWKLLSQRYGLMKLHANTQLYFSRELVQGVPATAQQIVEVLPYASTHIKRLGKRYPRIEVAARNFGISAADLRKKLGVADGGDMRLIGATDAGGNRIMIITKK